MEFRINQKKIIRLIQKGIIKSFITFAIELLDINIEEIPHDSVRNIKKGDQIYVLLSPGNITKSLTNEFLDLIDYLLKKEYISISTNKPIQNKSIEPMLFIHISKNPNKYEQYPLLLDRFKSILGVHYFDKEFKLIGKKLSNLIKHKFLSEKDFEIQKDKRFNKRIKIILVIIAIIGLLIAVVKFIFPTLGNEIYQRLNHKSQIIETDKIDSTSDGTYYMK